MATHFVSPPKSLLLTLFLTLFAIIHHGVVAGLPTSHRWQPVKDPVYLQEVGSQIPSTQPILSIGIAGETVFVVHSSGLSKVAGQTLEAIPNTALNITRIVGIGDALWIMSPEGLWRLKGNSLVQISKEAIVDVTAHAGTTYAATGRRLFKIEGDGLASLGPVECPFSVSRLLSHAETLYLQGENRLTFFENGIFGGLDVYSFPADLGWDWGDLPSSKVRDSLSHGSRIYFATPRGLGVLQGMTISSIRGPQGLPVEDTSCLATGFTNDLWIGSSRGLMRKLDGHFDYFAGKRWLPSDQVNAIAVHGKTIYAATAGGLGIIEYVPFTLETKAAWYERYLEQWGQKRLGFTHKLEWDDGLKEFVREVSDNDGGYSGNYLSAESYRFAVTHDPVARKEAVNTFQALVWLENMTGIPGFPARAVWTKGQPGHKSMSGSGGLPAEWHDTADGTFEWKGDTSSDEIASHFHSVTRFLQLAAQGDEVALAKRHLDRLATHLLDHNWQLIDVDGKPTRWGRWDPDYFKTDEGRFDRGLQALEMLSFMKTAETIVGDQKYKAASQKLVELGYPEFTVRQRNHFPPENVSHFEDELATWSYLNLLMFEDNPKLRPVYRRSLERSYEIVRIESNPWYNFVYGVLTGNECDVPQSVQHLRDWPLDLIIWSYENSHRADLRTPQGYSAHKGGIRAFPPRETEPLRWDHWTMQADGGTGGRDVIEPGAWLLAYWMGRYHGFIEAPSQSIPLPPSRETKTQPGAKPYSGPERPVVK